MACCNLDILDVSFQNLSALVISLFSTSINKRTVVVSIIVLKSYCEWKHHSMLVYCF